jgi:metal-responsive CopG/Arc/MetJ family transcriptional regulator
MLQDTQIAVRIAESLLLKLDDLRRAERDVPSRAEMIRRLIERAYEDQGSQ